MPTADDYERLFEERDEEFDDFVLSDAQEALSEARQTPDIEIQRLIGGRVGTGVVVEVVETLEEIFVAFKWEDVHEDELICDQAARRFRSRFNVGPVETGSPSDART